MKKNNFIYIFCICLMAFWTSCEKQAIQTTTESIFNDTQLTTRDDLDCDECGVGCCCCVVELTSAAGGTLSFCGLCSGDYLCGTYNPPSPCSSISGIGKDITLSSLVPRAVFCVPEGGSFRIYNNNTSGSISIRFTCQPDLTDPDFESITIPPQTAVFFFNDGSCFLEVC